MLTSPLNAPPALSGAKITVPKARGPAPAVPAANPEPVGLRRSTQELEALFDVLYRVNAACGSNAKAPDRVAALIEVCLSEGCSVDRDIIGILGRMGFNPRHVAMVLKKSAGLDPTRYPWKLVSKGTYSLQATN